MNKIVCRNRDMVGEVADDGTFFVNGYSKDYNEEMASADWSDVEVGFGFNPDDDDTTFKPNTPKFMHRLERITFPTVESIYNHYHFFCAHSFNVNSIGLPAKIPGKKTKKYAEIKKQYCGTYVLIDPRWCSFISMADSRCAGLHYYNQPTLWINITTLADEFAKFNKEREDFDTWVISKGDKYFDRKPKVTQP